MRECAIRLVKTPARPLRFRLRTLLVAVTLAAFAVQIGITTYHAHIRHGQFQHSYQNFIRKTPFDDTDLARLKRDLTKLEQEKMDVSGTLLTDAAVADLKDFTSLKELILNGTSISDAGIVQLSVLQRLSHLAVHGTSVTLHGVYELSQQLPFACISFSDDQISCSMRGRELHLTILKTSPASLKTFSRLHDVRALYCDSLAGIPFTDSDLACFKDCHTLETLDIDNTSVGYKSVEVILGFQQLRRLVVPRTMSPDAVHQIKISLPQCEVITRSGEFGS